MKKRMEKNSLKFQIFLFIAIVIVGVGVAGCYSVMTVIQSNFNRYDEWCAEKISEFEDSYKQKYYKIKSIMDAFGYNENMQRLLSGPEQSSYEVLAPIENMERNLIIQMYNYTKLDDALVDIYVMDNENNIHSYMVYHNEEKLEEFLSKCSGIRTGCISDVFELGKHHCFAIAEPIRRFNDLALEFSFSDKDIIGRSIFIVKTDFLLQELSSFNQGKQSVYVLNQKGEIMLEPDGQKGIEPGILQKMKDWKVDSEGITTMSIGGYVLNARQINENGWKIVVAAPFSERLFYDTSAYGWLLVWPGLLACIIFFTISIIQDLNIFMTCILEHMEKIGSGHLNAKMEDFQKKEFTQIASGLNAMMKKINMLIQRNISLSTQLYREEAEKTNAMLLALQSQMNPHFLYNTIECIKNIGICYDVKEVEELSSALSDVLRYSLRQDNVVKVEQEMECIKNFITIQTIRFENKYYIEYEVDERLLSYPILRLSLQPLVENAMKHGLEMKNGKCVLHIRVFERNQWIYMQVEDNGTGMKKEKVAELLTGKKEKSSSVGIANLQNRLRLFYGGRAVLNIESEEGKGTIMTICIKRDGGNQENTYLKRKSPY